MQAQESLLWSKASPRAWYSRIDSSLLSIGFRKSEDDPNLYFIAVGGDLLILLLYVDDLFIIGEEHLVAVYKKDLVSEFEMTDLGLMHYYLGMEVWQVAKKQMISILG